MDETTVPQETMSDNAFSVDDIAYTFNERASSEAFIQILKSRFLMTETAAAKIRLQHLQKELIKTDDVELAKQIQARIDGVEKTLGGSGDTNFLNLDYIWLWAKNNLMGVTTYIEFCVDEFQEVPSQDRQAKAKALAMKLPPRLWGKLIDKANKVAGYNFLEESSGQIMGL